MTLPLGSRLLRFWPHNLPLDCLLQERHVCQLHPLQDDEKYVYTLTTKVKENGLALGINLLKFWPNVLPLDCLLQGRHVCQLHPLQNFEKYVYIFTSKAKENDLAIGIKIADNLTSCSPPGWSSPRTPCLSTSSTPRWRKICLHIDLISQGEWPCPWDQGCWDFDLIFSL